jgi:hypothetical protein
MTRATPPKDESISAKLRTRRGPPALSGRSDTAGGAWLAVSSNWTYSVRLIGPVAVRAAISASSVLHAAWSDW